MAQANTVVADSGSVPAVGSGSALSSYGENALALQNIPLSSGTVRVQGDGLPPEKEVWVAGTPVPVDGQGSFVAETHPAAGYAHGRGCLAGSGRQR